MLKGHVIAEVEQALADAGIGSGLIIKLLPMILADVLAGKSVAEIVADILALLKTP